MRKKLIERRKQAGYTQEALAETIGCVKMHISNIETGKTGASLSMVFDFCNAIKYEVDPSGLIRKAFADSMNTGIVAVKKIASELNIEFDPENLFEVVEHGQQQTEG